MTLREIKSRMVSWALGFAEKPYAVWAIFAHSLADSSFLPITIDLTFIPISLSLPRKAYIFAFWATIGSIMGAALSYFIGMELMNTIGENIVRFYNAEPTWTKMLNTFRGEYAEWTLVVASITPLPFSLGAIASGVAEMDFRVFLVICILGRSIRFFILAFLINKFGDAVREFLNRYSKSMAMIFFISLTLFIIYLIFLK